MQEEKVDSNDDEISPLEESSISPEDKDDEILKEEQEEEEKARVNDRRRFKSEEEDTPKESEVKDESPSLVPSYVEILEKKVQIAEEKLQEHIARVNKESKEFRTRQEKDLERRIQQVKKQLFAGLLSIADDLSRANLAVQDVPLNELDKKVEGIDSLIEGFRMIQSRFFQELSSQGVKPIKSVGEVFDPVKHEAIRSDNVTDKELDGKISEELSVGYFLNDEIIRPSRVAVGRYVESEKEK
ncbi:MAG: nucleotide exchange factor GrpE [bacterium]